MSILIFTLVKQRPNGKSLTCSPVKINSIKHFLFSSVNVCFLNSWMNILKKKNGTHSSFVLIKFYFWIKETVIMIDNIIIIKELL